MAQPVVVVPPQPTPVESPESDPLEMSASSSSSSSAPDDGYAPGDPEFVGLIANICLSSGFS